MREKDVLSAIISYLTLLNANDLLYYRRIELSGVPQHGGRFFSPSRNRGMSDLVIWVKGGPVICAEVKSSTGKQSRDQIYFESQLKRVGHIYEVWRSIEDFQSSMLRHGVVVK